MDDAFQKEVGEWIDAERNRHGIPGLIICARQGNNVLFHEAYGKHDLETGIDLNKNALVPVMSQTKTFTAAAILKLCEEGRLSLDDKLVYHLENLKPIAEANPELENATIRDALQHRAPLKDNLVTFQDWDMHLKPYPTSDALHRSPLPDMLQHRSFTNGEKTFEYSNGVYALLGAIIENRSGMAYGDFITQSLLGQNKLIYPSLTADDIDTRKDIIPTGHYDIEGKTNVPTARPFLGGIRPAGGIYATLPGISQFYDDLLRKRTILSETSLKEMMTFEDMPPPPKSDKQPQTKMQYGLGLFKETSERGISIGHNGGIEGYQSCTVYDDASGLTVSAISTTCTPEHRYKPNGDPYTKGYVGPFMVYLTKAIADYRAAPQNTPQPKSDAGLDEISSSEGAIRSNASLYRKPLPLAHKL